MPIMNNQFYLAVPSVFSWRRLCAGLSYRAHTTGNLPCHDSIDQYHTVARTTAGDNFHTGFATCFNVATITCLLFGTKLSPLASPFHTIPT